MNIRKKILGFLAVIGLWLCAFAPSSMVGNSAHAQGAEQTAAQKPTETVGIEQALNEFWVLIDIGLKLIYVVIWPMLFLAGIALDNSMVYGSFFHMDAPLWFFWNMTKNFANFALGFIVLFAILKGIFSSFWDKWKDARNPMEIIKKTLIAGVLIQASWFILAAVVDISTIATYAVWGMPMALLNDKDIKSSQTKILQTESHLELNNVNKLQEEEFRIWYKTSLTWADKTVTQVTISPCLTKKLGTNTYIVGRKYGDTKFNSKEISKNLPPDMKISDNNDKFPTRWVCIFGNKPYFFNEFPNAFSAPEKDYSSTLAKNINELGSVAEDLAILNFFINLEEKELTSGQTTDSARKNIVNKLDENAKKNTATTSAQTIEQIFKSADQSKDPKTAYDIKNNVDTDNKKTYWSSKWDSWFSKTLAPTVSQLIDKSQWFVGPFVTIYASIMDFANLSDSNSNTSSIGKNLGNMMIRVAVAVGLVFPLIALAVVLFIRIWFLRAVIAASPLLILANVFKDTLKIDLWKHFTTENILQAIFAPVITVFALSISMIFMTTLSNSLATDNIDKVNIMSHFGGELKDDANSENTHLTLAGFTIIYPKIVDTYAGATGDWFSWILLSFCGIGIMRFILFAAIKASWTIGAVGTKIKDFWENVFKTAPIIPIWGGVGFGTLSETMNVETANRMRENKIDYKWQKESMETYFTDKFATAKDDYGSDRTFSESEKTLVNSGLNSNNSNQVIETLIDRWFITKGQNEKETKENIQTLYNNSPEFKEMIASNINTGASWTAVTELLSDQFLADKFKERIDTSLSWWFKDKPELEKKIGEINASDKNIIWKISSFSKTIKIADKDYIITKDWNNQLKID